MQPVLKSSIDLTPIIGLLLALIVTMLAVSPSAESSVRLDQPPIHMPAGNDSPPPPPWLVSFEEGGSIWIAQGEETPRLTTPAEILAEVPPHERVYLQAEADTAYGSFAELASLLETNGRQIAIVNEDLT